ncbi:MAG TPA: S41 family peptidase [Chthonomonadaceae bacterium]|nr:S41 family peptidase [Chthonomonadaceae bacterium]
MKAMFLSGWALGAMTTLLLCGPMRCQAQIGLQEQPDRTLDAATRTGVIEGVLQKLKEGYVFPEVAGKMEAAIHARMKKGEYDNVTRAKALASTLTANLQEVCHDKHLRVFYSYQPLPEEKPDAPSAEAEKRFWQIAAAHNFEFEKVERMNGNVGYLKFNAFVPPDMAGETAAAAMNFLSNTNALIIDLRENHGGEPDMIALLCSYLFGPEPVHLNDIYWRPDNSTRQFWTLAYVPGKRYGDKPVYVLTSKHTFSGAEEFTYDLKNLKRATIIGETTGGGANPGGPQRIDAHFSVFVPMGRAINPYTHTNWEGAGVKPDIEVPADQALNRAYLLALKDLAAKSTDDGQKEELQRAIEKAQKGSEATAKK